MNWPGVHSPIQILGLWSDACVSHVNLQLGVVPFSSYLKHHHAFFTNKSEFQSVAVLTTSKLAGCKLMRFYQNVFWSNEGFLCPSK